MDSGECPRNPDREGDDLQTVRADGLALARQRSADFAAMRCGFAGKGQARQPGQQSQQTLPVFLRSTAVADAEPQLRLDRRAEPQFGSAHPPHLRDDAGVVLHQRDDGVRVMCEYCCL